ncbi:MAG TPA: sensor domain-containing diguanylate cyclase [Candidatus Angelobacter sp.]|nr:sensor domain-containing diguanylate cyclase [Candidatus Angelobacter sp.]
MDSARKMAQMQSYETNNSASSPPERFVVEVFSELRAETIQKRWEDVNVILRMSMLTGLQMQLEATLNLLCDMAADIVPYEMAMVYFWDEGREIMELRMARNMEKPMRDEVSSGNILNFWALKYGRPLLVERGYNAQADAFLQTTNAGSALTVPLFVSNRVMGSLQFLCTKPGGFNKEDAQLLWILSLVAENLLTREYANEGLLRFAFTDYLTGLRTRGYFEQQLELEFKRAERKQQKFALLMIDIDHFKVLNDTFGHHVGDQLLRDVTSILMKDMREVDTVARYGGEEFVIILPETTETGALYVAQRLRRAVEQAKFFAGSPHTVQHLTISIGVAVYDTDAQFKRDLIEFADAALYAAKHEGRNRVVCYSAMSKKEQREVS